MTTATCPRCGQDFEMVAPAEDHNGIHDDKKPEKPFYADCPEWCRVQPFHYHTVEGELKWG